MRSLLQITTIALVARILSTAAFGTVAVALSIVAIVGLTSHGYAQQAEREGDLGSLPTLLRAASVTGTGAAIIGALVLALLPASPLGDVLWAYVPVVLLAPVAAAFNGAAATIGGRVLLAARVMREGLRLGLLLAVLGLATLTPRWVGVVDSVAMVGYCLGMGVVVLPRRGDGGPALHTKMGQRVLGTLQTWLVLTIVAAAGHVLERLDLIMLGAMKGTEASARYDLGLRLTQLVFLAYGAVMTTFLPSVRGLRDGKELRRQYRDAALGGILITVPLVVGLALYGDLLVAQLFGPRYAMPVVVYALLGLAILIHAASGPNGYTLISRHRNRALLVTSVGLVVLDVILNAVLIPVAGPSGAATATVLAYVAANLSLGYALRPHLGGRVAPQEWAKPAAVLLVCTVAIGLVPRVVMGSPLLSLVAGLSAVAASAAFLLLIMPDTRRVLLLALSRPDNRASSRGTP